MGVIYCNSDYLCHHGVKGMKWGVRRYQDKYGRLTEEGKNHYGDLSKKYSPQILEAQKKTKKGESTGENYDKAISELNREYKARIKARNELYKEYGVPDAIKRRDNAKTDKEYAKASNDLENALNKADSDSRMTEIWKDYTDRQIDIIGGGIAKDLKIKNEEEVKDYVSAVLDRNVNTRNPDINPYLWRTYNKVNRLT